MPTIQVPDSLTIVNGSPFSIAPVTINYNNQDAPENSGYQFERRERKTLILDVSIPDKGVLTFSSLER